MTSHAVAEASSHYQIADAVKKVPAGYKQTEVGVIPEDWEVVELGSTVERFIGGGTPSRSNNEYWGNEIPWITVKDFATFNPYTAQESITKKGLTNSASNLIPKGTLITSTRMALGKAVVYQVDVAINQDMKALFCRQELNTKFLYFWFEANKNKIDELGSGSTVKGLSLSDLRKLYLILPAKEEQTAIANALSDVDALIREQEKLIAKKQAIKTATMQQLLTGRTRLPQFALRDDGSPKGTKPSELGEIPEDWEVVELGSAVEKFIGGGTPSRSNNEYWGNEIPWVTVKDFATFNPYIAQESITKKGLINSTSNLIPKGTLITSTRMALGKAVIYQVDVAINQDMKALFCRQILNTEFLYFWFEANKNKIDELGSGSTVKGLSLPDLQKLNFVLPAKKEQTAIATILSDMDEEIQALEQRLNKTRQIKQGMMQELLTGKTRLVKGAAND